MPKTITQKITFKNTTPAQLYDLYVMAKKHTDATGAEAKITNKEGAKFSVYDGYSTGKNLQLIKGQLIVQSWRASDWSAEDLDSTLIIRFEAKGKNTIVHMVQANVPDNQYTALAQGWHNYYWKPWQNYLAKFK